MRKVVVCHSRKKQLQGLDLWWSLQVFMMPIYSQSSEHHAHAKIDAAANLIETNKRQSIICHQFLHHLTAMSYQERLHHMPAPSLHCIPVKSTTYPNIPANLSTWRYVNFSTAAAGHLPYSTILVMTTTSTMALMMAIGDEDNTGGSNHGIGDGYSGGLYTTMAAVQMQGFCWPTHNGIAHDMRSIQTSVIY